MPVFPGCQRSIRNMEVSAPIPLVVQTGFEPAHLIIYGYP